MRSICLVLLLAGCVSTGTQVKQDQLQSFEKGKTTYAEVMQSLGQPNSSTINADGSRTVMYMYAQAQARPQSFIPFIGPLVGGADSRSNMVLIYFDSRGVLVDYSASESSYGTGTGLSAGAPMEQTDQPKQAE